MEGAENVAGMGEMATA